jgi:fimbrial chaperone protein
MLLVRSAAALIAALLIGLPAMAGSFSVAPVRIDMKMPRRAAAIEVQNTGDQPAQLQVERYRWLADRNGDDQLEATEDIIATPPIFTLAPGQKQIVRVLLFGELDPGRESSYRLILQETALNDPPPNAVQALLRISMPVFISPPNVKPDLTWTLAREAERWWLAVENSGTAHAQITAARTAAGHDLKAVGYLLPGEKRRVAVDAAVESVIVTLRDQAEQTVPVRTMP